MANMDNSRKSDKSFEQELSEALRYYGYEMPESNEEIEKYVKMFGDTKIELPKSIADAEELFDNLVEHHDTASEKFSAMAAQGEEGDTISKDILDDIKKDIKTGKRIKNKDNGNIE
ncbi:hypothetical protein JMN32_08770 [Fulvivirga sp. 29W222]|uniref:Uncharacterized protein n=1 Tax=Fulvivirga marina TaxID=2494733 RepID=A0A937FWN2_9BACT|nr:hypothetical protein [Fulvivirga marina]MBL6446398.1 hypothetical protein [Fulvivirga marina]